MNGRTWWAGALLALPLLAAWCGPARAQGKGGKAAVEVADLLPAQALLCVEARHPAKLFKEVEAVLKGSAVEDLPRTVATFRAKLKADGADHFFFGGTEALIFSPEVFRDLGRVKGAAFALTGVAKDGPEYVAVVLPGDSIFPSLFTRGFLAIGQVYIVGEVAGVPIYREKRRAFGKRPFEKVDPAAPLEETGPAVALTPGLMVFGSSTELVKQVILRSKGRSSEPALSSLSAYKDAAKAREKPGLFAFGDPRALEAYLERLAEGDPQVAEQWKKVKAALPPRGARSATASLTIDRGRVQLQARLNLAKGVKVGAFEALPDGPADVGLLSCAAPDSVVVVAEGLRDGPRRFEGLLLLLDQLPRFPGDPNPPGKAIRALEKELKLDIGKDVLGRVRSVAYGVEMTDRGPQLRVAIRARGAKAAEELAARAVPGAIQLFADGRELKKSTVMVGEHSITVFEGAVGPFGTQAAFGRKGDLLVLAPSAAAAAAGLDGGTKKGGVLANKQVRDLLAEHKGAVAVGVVDLRKALVDGFVSEIRPRRTATFRPKDAPPPPPPPPPPYVGPLTKKMEKAVSGLAPLVLTLDRTEEALTFEVSSGQLRGPATRALSVWIEGMLEKSAYREPPVRAPVPKGFEKGFDKGA